MRCTLLTHALFIWVALSCGYFIWRHLHMSWELAEPQGRPLKLRLGTGWGPAVDAWLGLWNKTKGNTGTCSRNLIWGEGLCKAVWVQLRPKPNLLELFKEQVAQQSHNDLTILWTTVSVTASLLEKNSSTELKHAVFPLQNHEPSSHVQMLLCASPGGAGKVTPGSWIMKSSLADWCWSRQKTSAHWDESQHCKWAPWLLCGMDSSTSENSS